MIHSERLFGFIKSRCSDYLGYDIFDSLSESVGFGHCRSFAVDADDWFGI